MVSYREGMSLPSLNLVQQIILTLKRWLTQTVVDEIYSALRKLGFPLAALAAIQEALRGRDSRLGYL